VGKAEYEENRDQSLNSQKQLTKEEVKGQGLNIKFSKTILNILDATHAFLKSEIKTYS